MAQNFHIIVGITLGYQCDMGIDRHHNLITKDMHGNRTNLGPLTQQRAKEIGEYLNRLAIHTPER